MSRMKLRVVRAMAMFVVLAGLFLTQQVGAAASGCCEKFETYCQGYCENRGGFMMTQCSIGQSDKCWCGNDETTPSWEGSYNCMM